VVAVVVEVAFGEISANQTVFGQVQEMLNMSGLKLIHIKAF
jgi:hypothetical protein